MAAGCTSGFLVSSLLMRNTIMTEKLARRGVRVPMEYAADYLDRIAVADACSREVVTLRDDQRISEVHALVPTHQGFPVVDRDGRLLGVITRRDFIDRAGAAIYRDEQLRLKRSDAALPVRLA